MAIFDDLVKLLEAEGDTLAAAANAIKTDIIDPFSSLSVTDIIKRFLAIIADTILQSAENVLLTLLDVFEQLMEGMIDVLTARLDIPVLSWLYHELTGEDSVVPRSHLPHRGDPGDDHLQGDRPGGAVRRERRVHRGPDRREELRRDPGAVRRVAARRRGRNTRADDARRRRCRRRRRGGARARSSEAQNVWLDCGDPITGRRRGAHRRLLCPAHPRFVSRRGQVGQDRRRRSAAWAISLYVSPNIATLINAKTSNWYANLNNAITGVSILKGIAAIPAAAYTYHNKTIGKVFAFAETFINIVWNVPVIANIIVNKDVWNTTYKSLILNRSATSPSTSAASWNSRSHIRDRRQNDDCVSVEYLIPAQWILMVTYGVCMIIAGSIYQFGSNQKH